MNKLIERKEKYNQFLTDRYPSLDEVVEILSQSLSMNESDIEIFDTDKTDIKERKPKNENLKVWVKISKMREGFACFLDITYVEKPRGVLPVTYSQLALDISTGLNCRVILFDPREESSHDYLVNPNGKIEKIILNVIEGEEDDYYDIGRILS